MATPQARAIRWAAPGLNVAEMIRFVLANLEGRFGSWKMDEEECDEQVCADPQLVAVLEFLASMLPDGQAEPPAIQAE